MTSPVQFYWPLTTNTGHSVALSIWTEGIILPRKDTASAYKYVYGVTGLIAETVDVVSGSHVGFVGATQDVSGNAWLLSYYGDITFLPGEVGQQAYAIPNPYSGDIFRDAAFCDGYPYFVGANGDLLTVSGGAVSGVAPGFGETVSSLATDNTNLYAVLPDSGNLATYSFTSPSAGSVSKQAVPISIPTVAAAAVADTLDGYFQGTAVADGPTYSQPAVYGPASGTVAIGKSLVVPNVNLVDSTQNPTQGDCSLTFYTGSGNGSFYLTGSAGITRNNTHSVQCQDTFDSCLRVAKNALYTAPGTTGTDTINIEFYDSSGQWNTLTFQVQLVSKITGTAVAVAGWSDSQIVSGASSFAVHPNATMALAANPWANKVLVLGGSEPDWHVSGAVSGTGSPTFLEWVSSGEQALVTDPSNGIVQVFNLQAGAMVPGQTITLADAGSITVTPDGMTAAVAQPSQNLVTFITNTLNTWTAGDTVALTNVSSVLALSSLEIVAGASGEVAFIQQNGTTWSTASSVSGLAFIPVSLATDGNGKVFAAGGTGTGYLAIIQPSGIAATTSWAGSADAIYYEQGQIAVADKTNNLIRVFSGVGGSLSQLGSISAPPGCAAFGYTNPSVWLCGVSGMWQDVFTAPFTLAPRRAGAVAVYAGSQWSTRQLLVGHMPTALAWDVSGSVWLSTLQNDLYSFDPSCNLLTSTTLEPDVGPNTTGNPSLGISRMVWWQDALWAASSMNESLMLVSGAVPAPSGPGTAVTLPVGLTADAITPTSVTLGWAAPFAGTPPIHYQVQYRQTGTATWTDAGDAITGLTEMVGNLSPTTSYDFHVVASNLYGVATSSMLTLATPTPVVPSAPTGLYAEALSSSEILFAWSQSNVGTATIYYQPQYQVSGTTSWTNAGGQTTGTEVIVTALAFSTTYMFRVIASNSAGSATSATTGAITLDAAPSAPTNLSVSNITVGGLDVSWSHSIGSPTIEYQTQYSPHNANTWTALPQTTSTTQAVSGLAAGSSYDFEVVASNSVGSATSSILTVSTLSGDTTWSATDLSGAISLSSSDLTASTTDAAQSGVRSSASRSSGLLFVQLTTATTGANQRIGLANGSWNEAAVLGSDANSISIAPNGNVETNGSVSGGIAATWAVSGNIDLAINFSSQQFWVQVNGGGWGTNAPASVSGSQTAGTSGSGPVISGPASGQLPYSGTLDLTGVTVSDSMWPNAGSDALSVWCNTGTLSLTPGSGAVSGIGTSNISYSGTDSEVQAAIQTIVYTAPTSGGSDAVNIQVYDEAGQQSTLVVPISFSTAPDPVAGTGGFSFASITGPYFIAFGDAESGDAVTVYFKSGSDTPPSGYSWWDGTSSGGTAPGTPGTPSVKNVTDGSANLSWAASQSGTTPINYQPQYRVSSSTSWVNFEAPTGALSVTITGLNPGTPYDFQVSAVNSAGVTSSVVASGATGISNPLIGQAAGSQNTGSASQPVQTGPAKVQVMAGQSIAVPVSITDTNWPHGGNDAITISCSQGTLTMYVNGSAVSGSGTASFSYSDTDINTQAALGSLVYTAGTLTGSDTISINVYDELGNNTTLNIPVGISPTSSGAPSPVTLTLGSTTASSVSLSWGAPSLGSAPLDYAVDYRATGSTVWARFATTGGNSLTVPGLNPGSSYDFRVLTSNIYGQSRSGILSATTGVNSALPGDPTGTVAMRIADMLESFGVNCFPNGQDGSGASAGISAHVQAMQYLTANTGMGLINRVYVDGTQNQINFCTGISQQMPSVKWTACSTDGNQSSGQALLDALVAAGCLLMPEGVNEPNNSQLGRTAMIPVATCTSYQQFIYSRYQPQGYNIANASPYETGSDTYAQDYYGTSLSTSIQSSTLWNGHIYPNNGGPTEDFYSATLYFDSIGWSPDAGILSEYHPLLYCNLISGLSQANYDLGAYWTACALLAGFIYYNVKALQWWCMWDYANFNPPNGFDSTGLFANYDPTQPYSFAKVIHNFFALCGDAGTNRRSFQPSELNYTVSGLPPAYFSANANNFGTNPPGPQSGGGQHALFQGSDGTFYLFIWNEQNAMATGTTPVTVNFNSVPMTKVVDYSLTNPITDTPTPIQTLQPGGGVSSVQMNLTTEVRVLVITHP